MQSSLIRHLGIFVDCNESCQYSLSIFYVYCENWVSDSRIEFAIPCTVAVMKFTGRKQPKLYLFQLNEKCLRLFIRTSSSRKPNRFFSPACSLTFSQGFSSASLESFAERLWMEWGAITGQDAALLILFVNFRGFGRETSIKIYTQKFITHNHSLPVELITYKSHQIHFCQIITCHCLWKSDNRWSIWPLILSWGSDGVLASLTFLPLREIFFSSERSEINTVIVWISQEL